MIQIESVEHRCADGRKIQCWLNRPPAPVVPSATAILTPGFARRMHQHSALAQYLVANGVGVVRFDSLDHLGLSDGDIADYTLSAGLLSLEAGVAVARRAFPGTSCSLVATSLTSRIALRYLHRDTSVARLIALSGVVNVRKTFEEAVEQDYFGYAEADLPEYVEFASKSIRTLPLFRDSWRHDWLSLETTLGEIAALSTPIHWFVGSDDDWIDREEIAACQAANPARFTLTWLTSCGHDISRNSSAARAMLKRIVALCSGSETLEEGAVIEPNYNALLKIALDERRIQRASNVENRAAVAGR